MNNEKAVNELLALQKRIEDMKAEKAKIEGELKGLLKRLEEDFGSDDPKQVERKIEAMRQQAAKLRTQVAEGLVVLQEEMR